MKYIENVGGWRFETIDCRVQLLQVDFRLGLLISDGANDIWVRIETAGRLVSSAHATLFDPEKTQSLIPILDLFNATVRGIIVDRTGRLEVRFEDDRLIEVLPDQSYEAWQVEYLSKSEKLMLVCAPGSEVVVFQEDSVERGASRLN